MTHINKENLKEYVSKLLELEQEEEKIKRISGNLKKEKEQINNLIIDFMDKNNIKDKDIILGEKKIAYAVSKTTESITKKLILERLTQFLQNENNAKEAVNYIYADRNSKEKYYLKISNLKKN